MATGAANERVSRPRAGNIFRFACRNRLSKSMAKFFLVPTKICENIVLDILKGVCEEPWKKWHKFSQTVKTQYNQIYIYSPWKQRPNQNYALPLSKQKMHIKLFKQDLNYFSKKISFQQKSLITFLLLYQWDFCCCIIADRDFTLGLYFVTFRDIH